MTLPTSSPLLSARFQEALVYAAELHVQQRRKASDVPYLAHLLAVAAIVLEHGGDEDEAIAALLHDAVEDQGGPATHREILRRFGPRVASIVDGCTDTDVHPKPPWRERKEAHLKRLAEAHPSVHLVVAADKLHNARSLVSDRRRHGDRIWQAFRGGREGTLWYYRAAHEILKQHAPPHLLALLEEAIQQLHDTADDP